MSDTKSSWKPVANGAAQRSILSPILFNIFLSNLDDGSEHTFSRFSPDTKVGGVGNMSKGCATSQRDLNRLEKWTP